MNTFITNVISRKLSEQLPGLEAQKRLAPQFRRLTPTEAEKSVAKESAALVLLTGNSWEELSVVLTVRSSRLRSHSGQISFPGGKTDPHETDEQAALREAYEEIGVLLPPSAVLGKLSRMFIPATNFCIQPIVAFAEKLPPFIINLDEVDEAFLLPLTEISFNNLRYRNNLIPSMSVDVPYWEIGKPTPLWGATAMVLAELLTLLEEFY